MVCVRGQEKIYVLCGVMVGMPRNVARAKQPSCTCGFVPLALEGSGTRCSGWEDVCAVDSGLGTAADIAGDEKGRATAGCGTAVGCQARPLIAPF